MEIELIKNMNKSKCKEMIIDLDKDSIISEDLNYIVLKQGNKFLGYISFTIENNVCEIERVFISKNFRYKSYGTKLLRRLFSYLATKNIKEIYVKKDTEINNFFIKSQFKEKGRYLYRNDLLKEKERKNKGLFGSYISIFANTFLAGLKIIFGKLGNSSALLADGFNSLFDVVNSLVVLFGVNFASKPADEEHPFGHGQIESIAGNIIGIILIITSFELITNNLNSIINDGDYNQPKNITIFVIIIAIIIKIILFIYKNKMGKELNSEVIKAEASDHKSDIYSSTGVLIGILLAQNFSIYFDYIAGIIVSFLIGKEGLKIIIETSNKIMDEQEFEFIKKIKELAEKNINVENVHDVYMKNSGEKKFLSFHVRMNKDMKISEAHDIIDQLEEDIRDRFFDVEDVLIHIDPCRN